MKKLIITLAILLWASTTFAQSFLTSDPQSGVTAHIVVASGVTFPEVPANPDGSLWFSLEGFSPGPYTFTVYAVGNGGWRSAPSVPLDAINLERVLNVRISQ